jgi:hypothetical protein
VVLPDAVEAFLLTLLAKDPAARFASAEEIEQAVDGLLSHHEAV